MNPESTVVVTGIGLVTPLGIGRDAFWEGILASRSTARTIDWLLETGGPTTFACPVDDAAFDVGDFVKDRKSVKLMNRAARHAVVAASLALTDAGLHEGDLDPQRSGVALGAGGVGLHDDDFLQTMRRLASELKPSEGRRSAYELAVQHVHPLLPLKLLPNSAATHIAINHNLRGESLTLCTACTSGTQALGEALRILRRGHADVMLAGGTDAMINPVGVVGFGLLGVLSTRSDDPASAARPFDKDRDGFVMGEGAAILVLERLEHARKRGARILARLAGYGCSSDAYRVTDERRDGSGPSSAMNLALEDAGLAPSAVQYVNAHGTGTVMNDRTEVVALRSVFGESLDRLPVSSTKSQIGHLLAASGAVEAAACVMALEHQAIPPTINFRTPDPECAIDVVPNVPRQAELGAVLSNSFGFGGQNACLVLTREER